VVLERPVDGVRDQSGDPCSAIIKGLELIFLNPATYNTH
jgi:hypothetical protein